MVVPFESLNGKIAAFVSTDGGASWTQRRRRSRAIRFHGVAGDLRTSLRCLPQRSPVTERSTSPGRTAASVRSALANDIVFSHVGRRRAWSARRRVPIDPVTSTVDHFIPGLAVDPATSGASTHLALTYYFYPNANCGGACRLEVGYISSPDARRALGRADAAGRADGAERDRS